MKTTEEKVAATLKKLSRQIDGIGHTPLRQILDACTCFMVNTISEIDVKRCDHDGDYYDKLIEIKNQLSDDLDIKKYFCEEVVKPDTATKMRKLRVLKIKKRVRYNTKGSSVKDAMETQILVTISDNPGIVKTNCLKIVCGRYWDGYTSSRYINDCQRINKEFNRLVTDGVIKFIPGKPLEVVEAKMIKIMKSHCAD